MLKKSFAVLLAGMLLLIGCSSGSSSNTLKSSSSVIESSAVPSESLSQEETAASEIAEELSALDSIGDVQVEKDLFDVTITVPADYLEGATQEDLEANAADIGYKVTLNDDGSATYTMTKNQHKELMKEFTSNINESLAEMIGSEDYPNITDISANDDYTSFVVTTKNAEPDLAESFAIMIFYTYSGMYHIFNGTTVDNIHVEYVNADSGEVISSADSKDLAESLAAE